MNTNSTGHITALCFINIVPTLLAIFGNGICIITITKTPTLQTTSNIWVGALCISDLIVGVIVQPIYYMSLISLATRYGIEVAWLMNKRALLLMANTSFFLLYFVTLDRYFAICHPFKYRRIATIKRCIIGAILAFLMAIPTTMMDIHAIKVVRIYGPVMESLVFLQIVVCYALIYKAILKQRQNITSTFARGEKRDEISTRKEDRRKAYTIGIVILILVLCYTPITLVSFLAKDTAKEICDRSKETVIASSWGWFFMLLNSSLNPILYCLRMKDIRKAAKRIFHCPIIASVGVRNTSSFGARCSTLVGPATPSGSRNSIFVATSSLKSGVPRNLSPISTRNAFAVPSEPENSSPIWNLEVNSLGIRTPSSLGTRNSISPCTRNLKTQ